MSGFVLNKRTGKLHKVPTHEQCNVDQIPRRERARFASRQARGFRFRSRCAFCFPRRRKTRA